MTISNPFELSSLDGNNGFTIFNDQPDNADADAGYSVSEAGDINGDGIDDLIIGTVGIRPIVEPTADNPYGYSFFTGTSYVVFGQDDGFSSELNLGELDGSDGFALSESENFYGNEHFVSDAGDFNGDGIDDIIIGSRYGDRNFTGESYIVFGREGGFDLELNSLDLDLGFGLTINEGLVSTGLIGNSVDGLGDINGDGYHDVAVNTGGSDNYVIFGSEVNASSEFLLSDLDGTNGFAIEDSFTVGIKGAGDFNGDGFSDFIVAQNYDEVTIVFGSDDSNFAANLDFDELDNSNSITINGFDNENSFSAIGFDVNGVEDINNDGLDDIAVVNSNSENEAIVQIIFGSSDQSSFGNSLNPTDIGGSNGFTITGLTSAEEGTRISVSVDSAGDFNGDGINDLLLGAEEIFLDGESVAASYLIFGREGDFQADINLADIDGTNGFIIPDTSVVSGAGDINNDGVDDIVVGDVDESFVIFGEVVDSEPEEPEPQPPTLTFESRIFATSGADEINLGGSSQVAFGLDGGDQIDFRFDSGANRSFGGDGDDIFLLGSGDRIFGGRGNDIFIFDAGGGNVITGNQGDDNYIIADTMIPESSNTITDFVVGDDLLIIQGLGVGFADLSFRDSADGAIISLDGNDLAVLTNRTADFIANQNNFIFVGPNPPTTELTISDNQELSTDSDDNVVVEIDGDDTFLLGSGDRNFGIEDNVVTSKRGDNEYMIADGVIPESSNNITDFVVGDDLLALQTLGASFADLSFSDSADGVMIALDGNDLATLTNRNANFIANEDNFDFVSSI